MAPRHGFESRNPVLVLGRVPLFFFITHFYGAPMAAALMAWLRYGNASRAFPFGPIPSEGGSSALFPPGFGYELWVVYAAWALVVVSLYPACRWLRASKRAGAIGG